MRKRSAFILVGFVALTAVVAGVSATFFARARHSPAARLIGSWEGEGDGDTRLSIGPGGVGAEVPLKAKLSARATFNRDGTMAYSLRAKAGDAFNFSFEVPDPGKPGGEPPRWEVVGGDRDRPALRMFGPQGPVYDVVFRGNDEFEMTPRDPATGSGTITFRRTAAGR